MSNLSYKTKTDLGAGAACVAVGVLFAAQSWGIPVDPNAIISSRFVPLFLSLAIAGSGIFLLAVTMLRDARTVDDSASQTETEFADADIRLVALIVGCGAVYVVTFWAVGFLVATALTLFLTLLAFGNHGWIKVAAASLCGAVVYQVVFMRFMLLDDPAGALIDASALGTMFSFY